MKIGINQISFYIPKYYLDLKTLAKARGVDPLKYTNGLLQKKMSVAPLSQDPVSMGANAALQILKSEDIKDIDLVLFSTETGNDYSKSASTHLLSLLGLKKEVRAIELKQACYAVTAALYFAKGHILQNPSSKVLVIGSDIARYGLNSDGEPTQGAGAVAMIIAKNPKIMVLNDEYGIYSEDIYDFFRPNGSDYAVVDGKFSNEMYKKMFQETFNRYQEKTHQTLNDFKALIYHIPYSKIGLRSLQMITNESEKPELFRNYQASIKYNQEVGNIYTGSLFLSLISLLENGKLKANDLVGMYSYGSGAVAEFFTGKLVRGYKKQLHKDFHKNLLKNRVKLNMKTYESLITTTIKQDIVLELDKEVLVQLKCIENQRRIYQKKD